MSTDLEQSSEEEFEPTGGEVERMKGEDESEFHKRRKQTDTLTLEAVTRLPFWCFREPLKSLIQKQRAGYLTRGLLAGRHLKKHFYLSCPHVFGSSKGRMFR